MAVVRTRFLIFALLIIFLCSVNAAEKESKKSRKEPKIPLEEEMINSFLYAFVNSQQSVIQKLVSDFVSSNNMQDFMRYAQHPDTRQCWSKVLARAMQSSATELKHCITFHHNLINIIGKPVLQNCRTKDSMTECMNTAHVAIFRNFDKLYLELTSLALKEFISGVDKSCFGDIQKQLKDYIKIMNDCGAEIAANLEKEGNSTLTDKKDEL